MRALAVALLLVCAPASAQRDRLKEVRRWGYQLQGTMPHPSASLDCLVVDGEGFDKSGALAAEVRRLKQRAGKPNRIVLAYLSIGEAEDYRSYWKPEWHKNPPAFLAAENKQWKGNFKVRYWDPAWQAIVLDALDKIVAAGFDGVYLDIIDAYEYFGPGGPHPERKSAADDMSRFVLRLAQHARVERSAAGFLVVPQNGATIIDELPDAGARAYLDAVDAIGAEDTFFFGAHKEDNPERPQKEVLAALARFRDAGKTVLAVEYLTDRKKIARFLELARTHRFVPAIARRSLDQLVDPSP